MKSRSLTILAVLLGLVLSACTSTSTSGPTQAPAPTVAPAAPAGETKVTVFAAASLTDAFNEIGEQFKQQNPGVTLEFNYAGSQQLRAQLEQGAVADVFASANTKEMNAAIQSGLVVKDTQKTFVRNRLAIIVPKDNPGGVNELKDLSKSGLKIVLAIASVPVGGYALTSLDKMNADFGATFSQTVLANVVSYEDNVKQVVAKVQLGEADAGIVYSSDVTPSAAEKVVKLDVPDKYNTLATYPIAVLKAAPQADLAQKFMDYVLSDAGQAVLLKWGFLSPKAAAQAQSSTGGAIKVTDALGREVMLEKAPEHIAIVGKAFFMSIDAAYLFPNIGPRVIAVGQSTQSAKNFLAVIDPSAADKAAFETSVGAEQIAPLKPDLVILKSSASEKLGKPLEQLGIPVVYVELETPEQYTRDITFLGQILGTPDRAAQILAYYQGIVDTVTQIAAGLSDDQKPTVALLQYSDKGGEVAFSVPPATWIQTMMVDLAGGKPVWTEASDKGGWKVVNLEQIAAWNPDQIYIIAYNGNAKDIVAKLKTDSKWAALKAVKNRQIFGFAGDFYSWDQPDTRWGLGLLWLVTKMHPDQAKDIDIMQEVNRFYTDLYGMKADDIQAKVTPVLVGDLP
ncbi:MAG: molybdate ABC transporter substrate-binding protein [Anaerolineae bacterium]